MVVYQVTCEIELGTCFIGIFSTRALAEVNEEIHRQSEDHQDTHVSAWWGEDINISEFEVDYNYTDGDTVRA